MSELRTETINLIEKMPEEFLIKMDFKKFQVCVNKEIITEYKEQIQKKSN